MVKLEKETSTIKSGSKYEDLDEFIRITNPIKQSQALFKEIRQDNFDLVSAMLDKGITLSQNSLKDLLVDKYLKYVKLFVSKCEHFLIKRYTSLKDTALMIAIKNGAVTVVNYILNNKIHKYYIEAKNVFGDTPLILAIESQSYEIVKYVVDAGAITTYTGYIYNCFRDNIIRTTPIMCASMDSSDKILRYILDRGGLKDIDKQEFEFGNTALMYAARCGQIANIRTLLKYGANLDITNSQGKTAYDLSKEKGFEDIEKTLTLVEQLIV